MFYAYLSARKKVLLVILLGSFPSWLIAFLYGLPIDGLLYAMLLSILLVGVYAGYDFWRFYRKHIQLQRIRKSLEAALEELPESQNLIETDYQNILRQLQASKRQAVSQADQARADLIEYYTLWGHQIKTPIAALDLLLQTEKSVFSETCSAELFKIEQYVQMLLSYLRLDSGSTDFVIRRYDLDSILRQAVRKYAKLFVGRKLTLNFQESHEQVLTDEKWLGFVVEQLLSNAIKYTQTGTITILTEDRVLMIQDTGIGIVPEDLPRVFEKGFTGYNGRLNQKSTGIGLYLCQRILVKLGHSIKIESQLGKGTTVSIELGETSVRILE